MEVYREFVGCRYVKERMPESAQRWIDSDAASIPCEPLQAGVEVISFDSYWPRSRRIDGRSITYAWRTILYKYLVCNDEKTKVFRYTEHTAGDVAALL